jgi:hypothetical protein
MPSQTAKMLMKNVLARQIFVSRILYFVSIPQQVRKDNFFANSEAKSQVWPACCSQPLYSPASRFSRKKEKIPLICAICGCKKFLYLYN